MPNGNAKPGFIRRLWRALNSPSARWSVLALTLLGVAVGAGAVISTQVMVAVTGTDAFCGGACHSMQWVAAEHKASTHGANSQGVAATCADCHIPHDYPYILWYKAKAGTRDAIQEMRGVISTEEKFLAARKHMAESVWAEFRETDSANCRTCHVFTPEVLALQKKFVRGEHEGRFDEGKTCIDCHKGVAHEEPESDEEGEEAKEAEKAT
jgi:nitrate/TMAO reductase-like tetraheme cytochrome c subunit